MNANPKAADSKSQESFNPPSEAVNSFLDHLARLIARKHLSDLSKHAVTTTSPLHELNHNL